MWYREGGKRRDMATPARHVPILAGFIAPPRPGGIPGDGGRARDRPDGCQARLLCGSGAAMREGSFWRERRRGRRTGKAKQTDKSLEGWASASNMQP